MTMGTNIAHLEMVQIQSQDFLKRHCTRDTPDTRFDTHVCVHLPSHSQFLCICCAPDTALGLYAPPQQRSEKTRSPGLTLMGREGQLCQQCCYFLWWQKKGKKRAAFAGRLEVFQNRHLLKQLIWRRQLSEDKKVSDTGTSKGRCRSKGGSEFWCSRYVRTGVKGEDGKGGQAGAEGG